MGHANCVRVLSAPSFRPSPSCDPNEVYAALEGDGVPALYPGFRFWFFGKVVPELKSKQRHIIVARRDGLLGGVAVCKRSDIERKLCTLWVRPNLRERGLASELARDAFEWLDTDRPLFTVPEEHFADFSGLVGTWGFQPSTVYQGLYRTGRAEHVFNGPIGTPAH